ncbi:MAG TPA: efflux RND transporter periplasmic adaptor subunit [Gemmatimonadaceae bacterium]
MNPFIQVSRFARAALGVAGLAIAGCGDGGSAETHANGTQAVVGARTVVLVPQPFTQVLGAIGTVTARPGHVATLAAPRPARIVAVTAAVGQRVRAGTPLVAFDQTTFAGGASAAEAQLQAARRNHERTARLVSEGIAPRRELEQATSELAQAEAVAANARREASLAVLRSPIGGVVTRVTATLGEMADPVQPLVEVADPAAPDLLFSVSPTDAARIAPGAAIAISAGQGGRSGGEPLGIATVVDVGAAVDTASRTVLVRARAPSTRRPLRLGESVFGQVALGTRQGALVVPPEALVPEGERVRVFVVDAAGIAHAREVQVGGRTERGVEVVAGLAAGERVVTYGAYGVDDGAKIAEPPAARAPAATGAPVEAQTP